MKGVNLQFVEGLLVFLKKKKKKRVYKLISV